LRSWLTEGVEVDPPLGTQADGSLALPALAESAARSPDWVESYRTAEELKQVSKGFP